MADDEAAVAATELSDQPVINGFERLTSMAGASGDRAEPAERVTAATDAPPAWPQGDDPEQPPRPGTDQPQWPTLPAGEQVGRARWVLHEALLAHALGRLDDPDRWAGEEIARGNGQVMATALRALAAEGRARVRTGDHAGQALQALGISQISAHLDAVADRMASAAGFSVPDFIDPTRASSEDTDTARARADATALFDSLSTQQMHVVLAGAPRVPPSDLSTQAVPALTPHDLRSPHTLRRELQRRMEHWSQQPVQAPAGVPIALAIIDDAVMTAGFDYPARITAIRAVGLDPAPLHTTVRLRQFADLLDGHFATPADQRAGLGTYDHGRTLAEHLRAIATQITRITQDPSVVARIRVENLFGTHDTEARAIADRTTTAQPEPAQPAPNEAAAASAGRTTQPAPAAEAAGAQPDNAASDQPTPYRYNPHLLPEHAVVGSLVHAPKALDDLEEFLGVRDFSDPDIRAVYQTLRGLHATDSLFDVASMPSLDQQYQAANDNQLKLFTALRTGHYTSRAMSTSDAQRVLGQIAAAAPAESVPFRGVYDPVAQLELARMVKEDSIRRQATAMGISMRRATPLIQPAQLGPGQAESQMHALVANLELIDGQVDHLARQVAEAVKRTGPDIVDTVPGLAEATITQAQTKRWRIPDRFKAITEPLLHRAERHILHLALHSGRMDLLPESIRTLSPDVFSDTRHANTWRVIQEVQARGLAVNYVSVRMAMEARDFAGHPVLPERVLLGMAQPPDWTPERVRPERIARSLRMVVSAGLARARQASQEKIAAVMSAGPAVPAAVALNHAKQEIGGLAARAKTALEVHRELAARQQASTRNSTTR